MKKCSYCGKLYPNDQAVCPSDATPLDILPDLSSPQAPGAAAGPGTLLPLGVPAREALVTLVVLVLCLASQKLTIPTVDTATAGRALTIPNSIFVLGVQPLLSGFVLVELAALLVPVWGPLRIGGPMGREKLRRA